MLLLILIDPNSGPRAGWPPMHHGYYSPLPLPLPLRLRSTYLHYLPIIYIHTINFRKNCRSLVKYFLTCIRSTLILATATALSFLPTCTSAHSIRWLARPFFNNLHPPSPFLARSNKYRYPTPVRSWFATCSMKL